MAPMPARWSIALAVSSVGVIETTINCLRWMPIAANAAVALALTAAPSSSIRRGRSKRLVMFSPNTLVKVLTMVLRR
jgi:hypothetical protein